MYNFPLFHLIFSTFSSSSHLDNFLDVITEHDLQHNKLTHVTSDATEIELTLTSYDRTCNNIDESYLTWKTSKIRQANQTLDGAW